MQIQKFFRVQGDQRFGVVIVKKVVVIIGAMKDDVDVESHCRYIYLVVRIIIAVFVTVTYSIVVLVAVDVAVRVALVANINFGVVVANAVAIVDAVPFVGAGAFDGSVSDVSSSSASPVQCSEKVAKG